MSSENIERFSAEAKNNSELAEEIKKLGSDVAGIVKLAECKGFPFTEDELKEYSEAKKGELSEEQLEKVAGGVGVVLALVAVVVV